MGKADLRLKEAKEYFQRRYDQHVRKCNEFKVVHGDYSYVSDWTFAYFDDWDMIRKLTLHMFGRSTVSQLTDTECILANQVAKNITKMIFDQLDIIGHSQDEINFNLDRVLKGETL